MNAIETLISVLCDSEGKCCISGSDDDRRLIDSALAELTPTAQAAESVTEPAGVEEGDIDAVALARYKVVPAHESMFHRFAVVAGDGKQQLYLGREVECENMARKFAGAFLDGAFYQANITPSTQAAGSVPAVEREQERIAFKDAHRHLELYEVPDAWGRPMFKHSHVEASWLGWIARASHGQAPASVLHLVHSAFAEIAMAFPKAFALHKVGIADTAVREAPTAIQGETNVQLDIDSNHSAPGQQRDVARSVALGQPMGNGQDQAAGHLGAQGDKLLTVAERNIRSFLRSAQFKSESDREAALNCVDVLWEAARATAESVPAPPPPPECETEAEKRAFAFGWFKALESERMKADNKKKAPL